MKNPFIIKLINKNNMLHNGTVIAFIDIEIGTGGLK
jgi:hypothetical protein